LFEGRYRTALKVLDDYLKIGIWDTERAQAATFKGVCYYKMGDDERAVELWHEAHKECPKLRGPMMTLANFYHERGDMAKARHYAEEALEIPYLDFYGNSMENYGAWPHQLAYWGAWETGDRAGARRHWEKARALAPDDEDIAADAELFVEPEGMVA
jgi:tetratricopeptide (TPR) repeat protein